MVFFCGAGISMPTGLPDFAGLIEQLYSSLHIAPEPAEERAFERRKFDEVLGLLEGRLTPNAMRAEIARILSASPDPESLHLHRALLQVSRNASGSRLVTTNYDDNFARADPTQELRFDAGPGLPDVHHWNSILHIHGRLERSEAQSDLSTLVLTKRDFGKAYLAEQWAARFVRSLVERYTVVFVGYSLGDVVVEYLMTAVTDSQAAHRAYALAGYSNPQEFEERESKWKQNGVLPILYDSRNGHELLVQTVEEWARLSADPHGYRVQVATSGLVHAPNQEEHEADPDRVIWALTDPAAAWPAFNRIARDPIAGATAGAWLEEFAVRGLLGGTISPDTHERGPGGPIVTNRAEQQVLQPDSVADAAAYWIEIHAHAPEILRWVLERGPSLHYQLRRRLWDRLTSKDGKLPEIPERIARLWTLLLTEPPEDYELLLRLGDILASTSQRTSAATEDVLLRLLSPRLAVFPGRAPYLSLPTGSTQEEIALLECGYTDIIVGCRDQHRGFNVLAELEPRRYTDFLKRNAATLTDYLKSAFRLLEASDGSDASYVRFLLAIERGARAPTIPAGASTEHGDSSERTGEHRFANSSIGSWTILLDWVVGSYYAFPERDGRRNELLRRWAASDEQMLWFLGLEAITRDASADFELVHTLILTKSIDVLWDETYAEGVLTILEAAGRRGSARLQRELVEAVQRRSPPDPLDPNVDGSALAEVGCRLAALQKGGVVLTPQASGVLAAFDQRRRATGGDPRTMPVGLSGHIRDIASALATGKVDTEVYRAFAERRPVAAILALGVLGRNGNWQSALWNETVWVVAEKLHALKSVPKHNRRLADALLEIPDELFDELSFGIARLVNGVAGVGSGGDDRVFWDLWSRGWEHRSQKSGLLDARDALMFAMNTTAGMYAGAALKRIRATTEQEVGSIPPDHISRLERIVWDETGSAGLVMLVFSLDWLYRHAPDWTKHNILPRMRWDRALGSASAAAETRALWQVFALKGEMSFGLLEALGLDLWTAVQRNSELRHDRGLVRFFVHASLRHPEMIDPSVRRETARLAIQDNVRQVGVALADALERSGSPREQVWKQWVRPWLEDYWPREKTLNTAQSSTALVDVIMRTGDEFPDAVDWANGYVMALNDQQVGRVRYAKQVWRAHPRAAVALLHRIVGKDRIDPLARAALGEMVKSIKGLEPAIAADSRFVDLEKRAAG